MLLAFSIACFYPVFGLKASKEYIVCEGDTLADIMLSSSEKWQTKDYFVYKLSDEDKKYSKIIPGGKSVSEYYADKENKHNTVTPVLQGIVSGGVCVYGAPYIID